MKAEKKIRVNSNSFLIALIILTIVLSVVMLLFNNIVIQIRLTELKYFLVNIQRTESNYDFIFMVSKFRVNKKLYENKITESDAHKQEFDNLLYFQKNSDEKVDVEEYSLIAAPVIKVINLFRLIFGDAPMRFDFEDNTNKYLDIAYYFERNKQYEKAIGIFDQAYDYDLDTNKDKLPIILLHKGYCNAIMGNYPDARKTFVNVINDYSNEKVKITASMLLKLIDDFQKEIIKIKAMDVDPLVKSEKLFKLIAYDEAMDILEDLDPNDSEVGDKIKYYKARIYEEKGNTDNAIKEYQNLINTSPSSDFAKVSNRRILLISTENEKKEDLTELALKNNEIIKDTEFNELYDESRRVDKEITSLIRMRKEIDLEEEITLFEEDEEEDLTQFIEKNKEELDKKIMVILKEEEEKERKEKEDLKKKEEKEIAAKKEKTKAEKERLERLRKERLAREKVRRERERKEKERKERERKERELKDREQKERLTKEKKEREEQERLAREKKEREEKEKKEREKVIVEVKKTNPKSTVDKSRTVYYRNKDTNEIIKAEVYGVNGNLEKTYIYEYDENRNPYIIIYDAEGNILE